MVTKLSISAHDSIGTVLEHINNIRTLDEDELALRSSQKFIPMLSARFQNFDDVSGGFGEREA